MAASLARSQQEAGREMLNTNSLDAVRASSFSKRFVQPLYASYCFSNIPQTITYLLTGHGSSALPLDVFGNLPTRYARVILFFVDAFGWRFFERYAEKYAFLRTILKNGVASKMTAQFPSTTAAHATCIHTGLDVGQSGVYEWQYYEPLVDTIIMPLLFAYARQNERDSLKRAAIPASAFYPRQTLYQALKTYGVVPYIFQSQAYTPSTFSEVVFQGAQVVPYKSIADAMTLLAEVVLAHRAPPYYYYLYFDRIDAMSHTYGPGSKQLEKEVEAFFTTVDQLFYQKVHGKVRDTLLIITADHGQVEVDPRQTIYLNRRLTGIEHLLQTNAQGQTLAPAGSARDMFLHVQREHVEEACSNLRQQLAGKAEVYPTAELVAQHFFGLREPSQEFLSRVGNVVLLPYQHETTWWYEAGKFDMHFLGHHGGLTPEEMEIPLLVLPL
jgi:predicted AlkP superfamily pyrophosphatase or phosphodiesterase